MSLSLETRDHYTQVIDSILGQSDLTTISEKRVRRGLQDAVGYDLTPQKTAIKQLIMKRFDIFADQGGIGTSAEGTASTAGTTNGHEDNTDSVTPPEPASSAHSASPQKRPVDSDEPSELSNNKSPIKSPPLKKTKLDNDVDADAVFAAKLQAEENMRARPTRGANTRKAAPAKKKAKPKTKTSKKVKAEDDSDVESGGSDSPKKEVNRSGGFHKPLNLSPALSSLLDGEATLSRPQTVKRVWQYIREHNLQDPSDRRQIRCDDAMRAVFKQERVHMFTMTKILNQNLYSPDE